MNTHSKKSPLPLLECQSRQVWRNWLLEHHETSQGIWLVFVNRSAKTENMTYDEAVEEAMCFGWIDSIIRNLDLQRYARKFTPRKPNSRWSTINRNRYESLRDRGLLMSAGLKACPTGRCGDAPKISPEKIPAWIEERLRENDTIWRNWLALAPSYRRHYIGWLDAAKRPDTRKKRIDEALDLILHRKKLGLK